MCSDIQKNLTTRSIPALQLEIHHAARAQRPQLQISYSTAQQATAPRRRLGTSKSKQGNCMFHVLLVAMNWGVHLGTVQLGGRSAHAARSQRLQVQVQRQHQAHAPRKGAETNALGDARALLCVRVPSFSDSGSPEPPKTASSCRAKAVSKRAPGQFSELLLSALRSFAPQGGPDEP